jgi:aryl-alcohol dehydrogenase-like predicted oxidoreductase
MTGTPVPRTTLGRTGLGASSIGLGLAAIGRPAYITLGRSDDLGGDRGVRSMEQRCHRLLDAAYGAGVRYVDTARSYGLAEAFVASWLDGRSLPAGTMTVGSKWGYRYVGAWRLDAPAHEVKDPSLAAFVRQREESAALLGDNLGLYQVHSATMESGVLEDRGVLEALARLRERGVVIGLSVSGPRQSDVIHRAGDVEVDGEPLFGCVQATFNVLEPSAGPALEEAHRAGVGVLVKEVLANGRLSGAALDEPTPVLGEVALAHGATVDQVAFASVVGRPWVDSALSGAVTGAQLRSHCGALDVRLTEEDRTLIEPLAEPPESYWRRRQALPWH